VRARFLLENTFFLRFHMNLKLHQVARNSRKVCAQEPQVPTRARNHEKIKQIYFISSMGLILNKSSMRYIKLLVNRDTINFRCQYSDRRASCKMFKPSEFKCFEFNFEKNYLPPPRWPFYGPLK